MVKKDVSEAKDMQNFNRQNSLFQFQKLIQEIYGPPADRLYSILDLLTQQQRFAMRALKGIRKGDKEKLKKNLFISFSWLIVIANRFHINVEAEVWRRFPMFCSYCGRQPCACKKIKPATRAAIVRRSSLKPMMLADFQKMFAEIYPPQFRTLVDAGLHFAEEIGEVGETIHGFLGEHKNVQFNEVKNEIADCVSCIFGIANSAAIDIAKELEEMYYDNCHACHIVPCVCNFSSMAKFQS